MNPGNVPEGSSAVSPYVIVPDVDEALAFYEKAFGVKPRGKMAGPDGRTVHADFEHGGVIIMVGMPMGPHGAPAKIDGDPPIALYLYVDDVDKTFEKAVAAGCTVKRAVADQFYGDRTGCVVDPFGHNWTFGKRVRTLTMEEMERAFADMLKAMAQ